MSITDTARDFFDACETGKGWAACSAWCHPDASFACQSDALADTTTLEAYTEWMKGLVGGPLPDGRYTLHSSAWDEANSTATFVATFHATHKGEGGPVAATNKATNTDYVYSVKMNGDGKVASMTKIWNDGYALAELGWA